MRWSASLTGLVVGLVYAFVYFVLAVGAAGAGHGTGIFFAPVMPYGLGLLVFPFVGFLLGNMKSSRSKTLFLSAMALHYALAVYFLRLFWVQESSYTEKMWAYSPGSVLLPAWLYVCGQAVIWMVFIRQRKALL